jgi:chromosome partitioning protein
MIVVFASEKGGTGKSTLAVNVAAVASIKKKSVLLIDTDIQATAHLWALLREDKGIRPPVPCIQKHGKRVHESIQAEASKYDLVIVDAGGRDSPEMRSSILVADKLYIPIRASQFDAWTLDRAEQLLSSAFEINPTLKAYALINQASTNPVVSEVQETKDFIKQFKYIKTCRTVVRDRIAFRKAAREGLSVVGFKPADPKAVKEILLLYREVIRHG